MKRFYESLLVELLELFPCVAMIGARQCGKTTMLKLLPDQWKIYDLENLADYQNVSLDPDLFFRLNSEKIAIDECQNLPEIFPALRVAIDRDSRTAGRFIITGSSSPSLLKNVSETLAGRVAIIEMAPFSRREACELPMSNFYQLTIDGAKSADLMEELIIRDDLDHVHDYWLSGGYPEIRLNRKPRFRNLWMQNYIRTYVERDILKLFPQLNLNKFRLFIQMLGNLSGQVMNMSNVGMALGVSVPTVKEYLTIVHGTFLWRTIPSYEKNAVKRIIKHPKGYIRDTGLLHFLLRIHSLDDLLSHPIMGFSWESLVIEELIRNFNACGTSFDYFYYRTRAGAEVDLVLEGEFGLLPIEIKYKQAVSMRELRGIRDFMIERNCPLGIVINNDEKIRLYEDNLIGIPLSVL